MAVAIDLHRPLAEQKLESRPLFQLPEEMATLDYLPSPDGQRFLLPKRVGALPPITVVLNWQGPK